jgi:hypothetical protein
MAAESGAPPPTVSVAEGGLVFTMAPLSSPRPAGANVLALYLVRHAQGAYFLSSPRPLAVALLCGASHTHAPPFLFFPGTHNLAVLQSGGLDGGLHEAEYKVRGPRPRSPFLCRTP